MQQEADVLIRLEQEIRAQADEIIRKAEHEASAIRRLAEEEAGTILDSAQKQTETRLAQLKARRLMQATLESRQQMSRVKADAVSEAVKVAGTQLTSDQAKSRYRKALGTFLEEALESLKSNKGPLRIVVRKDDEAAVRELISSKNISASLDNSGVFSGGLEIIDDHTRTRVVNTFESRLRQGYEAVSERIRKVLRV